jgi:hypothetical protein
MRAYIVDADPQVTRWERGMLPDRQAVEVGLALVKHAGWNQAEGGLAVEAPAKVFRSPRHGLLKSARSAVIEPEDA